MGYCAGYPGYTNPGFGRFRGGLRYCWWRFVVMPTIPIAQVQPVHLQQQLTKEQELRMLEDEAKAIEQEQEALKQELEEIRKRIAELKKQK
jgi:hypothetical protein